MKKTIIATVVVFVVWQILDYIIHGVILMSTYEATSNLWRSQEEMKMGLMWIVGIIAAFVFVSIYARYFAKKDIGTGLKYGIWFGIGTGVSMGYGSYSVMPIPYSMALTWFLGTVIEMGVAGIITGAIVKE
ncbi:MAG: hypothetical protein ACE5OP_10175 [Candidatus Glassbacteria bacterium]